MENEGFKPLVNDEVMSAYAPQYPIRQPCSLVVSELGAAERLALAYAPGRMRARYAALLGFDAVLARSALSTADPLMTQLKLAWWRDACGRLAPTGHPVLAALAAEWNSGVEPLVELVDAWEQAAVGEDRLHVGGVALASARSAAITACAGAPVDPGQVQFWTMSMLAAFSGGVVARERAETRAVAALPRRRALRPVAVLEGLARRAARQGRTMLLGDRLSPMAAIRLGIFGR